MFDFLKPKKRPQLVINAQAFYQPSDSEKRKRLELDLVRSIENYTQSGLDIHYISIDLEKDGRVNARVTLNDKPAQED